ncbi:MAG: SpoIIE family protein phosphatase [Pseudomonadota bacterium]
MFFIIFRIINHYRHKDGHEVFTESTGEPILDEQGRLIKWRGLDRDITCQKEAEEAIRQTQVKLAVARNEMKIARQIQESLLPSSPLHLPEVHVVGYCLPAAQVGGDYFDFFHSEDGFDVVIADVSGHSVGPALFMVEARSALRTQTHSKISPAEILSILNKSLYEDLNHADHFITMFYVRYDRENRRLNYANAGHVSPLLIHRGESACSKLDADGLVLGVKQGVSFEEKRCSLEKGDMVFLYTDGITEVENKEGELFGTERLCDLLTRHALVPPQVLIDVVIKEMQDFCQSKSFNDDVTMVILKVRE